MTWIDARELQADIDMIRCIEESKGGSEFLVIQETFGLVRELPEVYMITTEKDNTGDETITVIPKDWVVSIE